MILANASSSVDGRYQITNSLRFQTTRTEYLTKTYTAGGNPNDTSLYIKTFNFCVKRGLLGTDQVILSNRFDATNYWMIAFDTTDRLYLYNSSSAASPNNNLLKRTTQVFRDPAAWYHININIDTTLATAEDRYQIWINGVRITAWDTNTIPPISSLACSYFVYPGQTWTANIGRLNSGINYFDGYLTELNVIDGQALLPRSFGSFDISTGQWIEKKYTGTYGANGFRLRFTDGTSTTSLGTDSSGLSNTWTLTNFARTAGITDCWMYDVPSPNSSIIVSAQPNSNYCVLNWLDNMNNGNPHSRGNLYYTGAYNNGVETRSSGTTAFSSGKYYFECTIVSGEVQMGIHNLSAPIASNTGIRAYKSNGQKNSNGTLTAYGSSPTTNDIIGCAIDADNGKIWWSKNNVWFTSGDPAAGTGAAFTDITGTNVPYFLTKNNTSQNCYSGSTYIDAWLHVNFGQRSFSYTPPTGFNSLCTTNIPAANTIPLGNKFMESTIYTGNGGTQSILNAGFKPDLFWAKSKSNVSNHGLVDSSRGGFNALYPNLTNAETNNAYSNANQDGIVSSFDVSGVTLGGSGTTNANGQSYVGWQWRAGNSIVTNTAGNITSQVNAGPVQGFSIVNYTGSITTTRTVGHGLGVAPRMIIIKPRNIPNGGWVVYHASLADPANYYLRLNTADVQVNDTSIWNNTAATSSVFSVGRDANTAIVSTNSEAVNYVAYCFSEIAGYSKFGYYTAISPGPFIHCGFKPKYVMIKCITNGYQWEVFDRSRNTNRSSSAYLQPNTTGAEVSNSSNVLLLSNGFRPWSPDATINTGTMIYAAFAECPFSTSNAS
ncbi:SPRY domain containing protein [uncultured Caudovirales phage]|uniref:SPRY domain containing protein n=1 Tax=uncultured Caudovirales phage TaxID=2100421 RepID=A0A6J5T7I8_9CAUD|nr:SPRY domain containing protein [uncultured Caudovirales phage]CAB4171025.1 SPRY domain containing protein [uncultured Caudovirales phage]CAB4176379.1 SPRY domain containing protein [uncultured Caudovirales phage]CAB4223031.1 SPRY domain containing protein [uncultured Caudovirales phage]